jgi:head-tail adaptor
MMTGAFRHYVDVFAPGTALDDRGQPMADGIVMRSVPCAIEVLSGREAEIARQLLPSASTRISMRGPIKGLTAQCILVEKPHGQKHHVGFVEDQSRTGVLYRCLCEQEA